MPIDTIRHADGLVFSTFEGIVSMFRQIVVFGIAMMIGTSGCGSSNPDAPSAPRESDVPKGDGSAPGNSPGVLKPPKGKKTAENTPLER